MINAICAEGQYKFPRPNECNDCPVGFACPTPYSSPIPCAEGFYANDINQVSCKRCEPGYKCPTIYDHIECGTGFYSLAGSVNCYPIPSGMKANPAFEKGSKPQWCATGEISALTDTECSVCGENKLCAGNNYQPDDCKDRRLNSRPGEYGCHPYRFTYPGDVTNPTD